jgi:rare lipoprotein A
MGTKVRVTNEANGKSEVVTINDRGPFIKGRIIDVTIGSAERLGFRQRGVVPVKVEVLGHADTSAP